MDIFVEQIVKKKFGGKDYAIVALTVFLGLVILFICMAFFPPALFLALVGVCAAAYFIITSRNLEFEYSVTNGDLTIDKIVNRRKRKRVVSLDLHNVEEMGKYSAEAHRSKSYAKRYMTAQTDDGRGGWYLCARQPQTGNVLVVFDPEEKVLNAVKPFLPRQVAVSAFRGY